MTGRSLVTSIFDSNDHITKDPRAKLEGQMDELQEIIDCCEEDDIQMEELNHEMSQLQHQLEQIG